MSMTRGNDISADLRGIAKVLRENVEIKDRKYHLKTYKCCFLGTEGVQAMLSLNLVSTVPDAIELGNMLIEEKYLNHVVKDHSFKNENLFYRFTEDEDHGRVASDESGIKLSWEHVSRLMPATSAFESGEDVDGQVQNNPTLASTVEEESLIEKLEGLQISPLDEHNTKLLNNVHPAKWINPQPKEVYDLVAIGAGAGGLVTTAGAAGVGARVALVEMHLLGGDCLNIGCVPSKALIRCARVATEIREAEKFGIKVENVSIDFPKVMRRMRRLRAKISPNDSAERFSSLGVDVFLGTARFLSSNSLSVSNSDGEEEVLRFRKAVIATGARAAIPNIEGLTEQTPFLTNATFFNLEEAPETMAVIGGGPIGLELAQGMQRLGCKVTVFLRGETLLPKEETEATEILQQQLARDGLELQFNTELEKVRREGGRCGGGNKYKKPFASIEVEFRDKRTGERQTRRFESLLLATGRLPNVEGLNLDAIGVKYSRCDGITVNDNLQTSLKDIYAVGDCCSQYKFTHAADFMARIVIKNALFFGRSKLSSLLIPWATYTVPEIAHVGYYKRDLQDKGISYQVFTKSFADVDRAILDGEWDDDDQEVVEAEEEKEEEEEEGGGGRGERRYTHGETKSRKRAGFVQILVRENSDEILGATVVSSVAGELIGELTLAMQNKIGLGKIATVIHPYPTKGEAIRQCGDLYNKTRLTVTVKKLLRGLVEIQR